MYKWFLFKPAERTVSQPGRFTQETKIRANSEQTSQPRKATGRAHSIPPRTWTAIRAKSPSARGPLHQTPTQGFLGCAVRAPALMMHSPNVVSVPQTIPCSSSHNPRCSWQAKGEGLFATTRQMERGCHRGRSRCRPPPTCPVVGPVTGSRV